MIRFDKYFHCKSIDMIFVTILFLFCLIDAQNYFKVATQRKVDI